MIGLFINLNAAEEPAADIEADLIAQAQQDPSEFAAIYRQYVGPVFYYLLSRTGNRSEAEDLTGQVFLEALEGLPTYRHRGLFSAWLFTIARHRLADFYRRKKPELLLEQVRVNNPEEFDPLAEIIQSEHLQRLQGLVAQLDEDESELLRLRFAAGLSFIQIAALQGQREPAIKMRYYRLLGRLQNQMEAGHD